MKSSIRDETDKIKQAVSDLTGDKRPKLEGRTQGQVEGAVNGRIQTDTDVQRSKGRKLP